MENKEEKKLMERKLEREETNLHLPLHFSLPFLKKKDCSHDENLERDLRQPRSGADEQIARGPASQRGPWKVTG
jgi:hypothetical protein